MDDQQVTDQRVSEVVIRLEAAVSSAPIGELRAVIEEDLNWNKEADLGKTRNSLEYLKDRASLGHRKSIEALIDLGNDIAYFLSDFVKPEEREESPIPPKSSSKSNEQEGGWRETIDDCVLTLLKLLEAEENFGQGRFDHLLESPPENPHVFPIRGLEGTEQFPDTLGEVTYLCDCLVQRRLNMERDWVLHDLSTHSLFWPLCVTAVEYQSKKSLTECSQSLDLGTAIAPNLGAKPRGENKPSALVLPLLFELERRGESTERIKK